MVDVATQSSSQWTLSRWADYFVKASDPDYTGKVYNVISLEITGTPLAKRVRPPRIVREIDWVDNCWHFAPKGKGNTANDDVDPEPKLEVQTNGSEPPKGKAPLQWPKVQLYCLMGIRGSWTVSRCRSDAPIQGGADDAGLARRLCGELGVLYYPYRRQRILLYRADGAEPQSVWGM